MIEDGRPRFWIHWYDRWNLVLPIGWLAFTAWLLAQPRPALPPDPVLPAAPPLVVTLESPASGTQVRPDRMPDVEGRATPGSTVLLFYSQAPSTERRELARMRVGADGRYRFRLGRFPAGGFVLQTTCYGSDGRTLSSSPVDLWVLDGRTGPARRQ